MADTPEPDYAPGTPFVRERLDIKPIAATIDGRSYTQFIAFFNQPGGPEIVGMCDVQHVDRPCAAIRRLFVKPEYRRQGIGNILMYLCVGHAEASKCKTVALNLVAQNRELLPFYERLQFFVAWEDDDGDLILARRLDA